MRTCILAVLSAGALCNAAGSGQPLVSGPVIVFLGPPGSGKSTQAAAASKYLKLPVVSAEALVEENLAELNNARRAGITGIEMISDPLLNKFFEARLKRGDLSRGMILDGYPNTKDHADFTSGLVASGAIPRAIIIHLEVPDAVVHKRLAGKDGKLPASVEQRLKDYHRETVAIEAYFPSADLTVIDGSKKPASVAKKVKSVLKAKLQKKAS